jgi:predicted TIM-barrel fold metal-dependent hydrolase
MLRRTILQSIAGLGALSMSKAAAPKSPNTCACGRVDVHAHFLPEPYQRALHEAGLVRVDGGMPVPEWSADAHLAAMAARGVTTSMLSVSSPGLHFLQGAAARRLARDVNEIGAGLRRDHPGQFGVFAALPLPDVEGALAEIDHAYDHLGVDGICLETNARGLYLGDPAFAPVFDALERRKAVVFLHPTSPECLAQIGMGYPAPLLEFPFDTARTVVSLVYAGVLRHRPNIRVILSHGGGALPILVSRIAMVAQTPLATPRPEHGAAEVLAEVQRLYFDLALCATPATLAALLQITDLSHVLFGTDYPFAPPPAIDGNTAAFGKMMDTLTPEQRRMVEYGNAVTLFPRLKAYLDQAGAAD